MGVKVSGDRGTQEGSWGVYISAWREGGYMFSWLSLLRFLLFQAVLASPWFSDVSGLRLELAFFGVVSMKGLMNFPGIHFGPTGVETQAYPLPQVRSGKGPCI